MSFVLDTTSWPLVITTIDGPIDVPGWVRYAEAFERDVIARQERIVSVFDMSGLCNLPDSQTRGRVIEWSRHHEAFGRLHHMGLAIVAPSPLARAVMTVLQWAVPPKVPTSFEADRSAALAYCARRLRAEGMPLPSSLATVG